MQIQFKVAAKQFDETKQSGTISIEADTSDFPAAIEALREGMQVPTLAVTAASEAGMADPRVNGMRRTPYAVDSQGNRVGVKMQASDPEPTEVYRYRVDIEVVSRII